MREFVTDIPDSDLDDLRHRLAHTRWPEPATVDDWTQVEKQFSDVRYWNEPAKGGHFAAFEQPAMFVDEVRAAFRAFR